jgi:hypothetical protein
LEHSGALGYHVPHALCFVLVGALPTAISLRDLRLSQPDGVAPMSDGIPKWSLRIALIT